MLLANIRVGAPARMLTVDEIDEIDREGTRLGGFTKAEFVKLIVRVTGGLTHNVDSLLLLPEAEKALVKLPGVYALSKVGLLGVLDPELFKKIANSLFKGKATTLSHIADMVGVAAREKILTLGAANPNSRSNKRNRQLRVDSKISAVLPSGRAPYSREVMLRAVAEIHNGKHPMEPGGVLFRNAVEEDALPADQIDKVTNNHLVRNRVKIVLRLIKDIVRDYAENNRARIAEVTIEMARDLKDLSGKTQKEIASEISLRLKGHMVAAKEVAEHLDVDVRNVSAGLIRKFRIARDMDWQCPYTGKRYDRQSLVSRNDHESDCIEKDHILPRSQRLTDSLDSLVLTYKAVNEMKGKRTGLQFVRECGGRPVDGMENLTVLTEGKYRELINRLKKIPCFHETDRRRQKRRIANLLRVSANEAEMTEGMLTRTSQITKIASSAIRGYFAGCGRMPQIVSIPGRVTAFLRRQWNLFAILSEIDKRIIDENGRLKLKNEIRDITHMHHAVDAITLGLAATLFPRDGAFWAMMCKRRVAESEKNSLYATGVFRFSSKNEPYLLPLPNFLRNEIFNSLKEQRVVYHQPQDRSGLKVSQNAWGIEKVEGNKVYVRQRIRRVDGTLPPVRHEQVTVDKAFGLCPRGNGKLAANKSVLLIDDNFGMAIGDVARIVRSCHVWKSISSGELVLRKYSLVRVQQGRYAGVWRVMGVSDNGQNGCVVELHHPCITRRLRRSPLCKENVLIKTLCESGLEIIQHKYTGVSICPITSSISRQTESRSR